MEYRNIDQDINLYNGAKRYWHGDQISKEQLCWILREKRYSEKEIDSAITDYYYIYIWPNILVSRLLWIVLFIVCFLFVVVKFF